MGGKASAQQKAAEEAKQRRAEKRAAKAAGQAGAAPSPGPMRPPPQPEPEPEPPAPNAVFLAAQAHIKSTIGGEDQAQVYIDALRTWLRGHGLPSEKAEVLAAAFTNAFGEGTESEWVPTLDSMDEHELEEFMAAALGNVVPEVTPAKVPSTMQEEVVAAKSQSKKEGDRDPEAISHVSDGLPQPIQGQPIADAKLQLQADSGMPTAGGETSESAVPDEQKVMPHEAKERIVDGDVSAEEESNGRLQSFDEEPPLLSGESDFDSPERSGGSSSGEDVQATTAGGPASEGVPPNVRGGRPGVASTGSTTADIESIVSAAVAVAKAEAAIAQDEAVAAAVSSERAIEAQHSEQQTLALRNLQERLEQRDASVAQLSQALEDEQVALEELRTFHSDVAAQLEQQLVLRAESERQYAEVQAEWANEHQARERAEQARTDLVSEVEALRATAASQGGAEAELAVVREQLEITRRQFAEKESEFEVQMAQLRKDELERLTTESLEAEILQLKAALVEASCSRDASHANFIDLSATVELMEQQLAQEQARRSDAEAAAVEAQAMATKDLSAAQLGTQRSEMEVKDSLSAQHEAAVAALKSAHSAQLAVAAEAERRQAEEVAAQVDWDRTEAHEGEISRLRAQHEEDKAKMEEQLAAAEDQLFELEQANDERIADLEQNIAQARAQTAEEQRRVAALQTELSDTRAALEAASDHTATMETPPASNQLAAQLEQSEQALREEQVRAAAALTQAQEAKASKLTVEETLERVQKQWRAEVDEMAEQARVLQAALEEHRVSTSASQSLTTSQSDTVGHDSAMMVLRQQRDADGIDAERHTRTQSELAAIKEENEDLSQQLQEALVDFKKLEDHNAELMKRSTTAEAEVSAMKAAQEAVALEHEEQLQSLRQRVVVLGEALEEAQTNADVDVRPSSSNQESAVFKTAMNAKQAQLDQADATIRELRAALLVATAKAACDDGGTTDEEVLQEVADAKNAAEAAQEDAQLALRQEQQRHTRTQSELAAIKEENEDLSQQLQEALVDFKKLEDHNAELMKRSTTAEAEVSAMKAAQEAVALEHEEQLQSLRQRVVVLGEALEEAQTNADAAAEAAKDAAAQQRRRDSAELADVKHARDSLFQQTEELRLQITLVKSEMEAKLQATAAEFAKQKTHANAARVEAAVQAEAAGKASGSAEAEARMTSALQAEEAKVAKAIKDMETLALQLAAAEESAATAQQAANMANELAASAKAEKSIAEMAALVAQEEAQASAERATAAAQAEARASLEAERQRVSATERELSAERAARLSAESFASEKAAVDRELSAARAEITRYKAHLEVAAAVAREESAARCAAEAQQQELEGIIELQTSQLAMAGQAAAAAADEATRRTKDTGDAALQLEQERTLAAERSAAEASATAAEGAVALKQMFVVLQQTQDQVEQLRHQLNAEKTAAHGAMQVRHLRSHSRESECVSAMIVCFVV